MFTTLTRPQYISALSLAAAHFHTWGTLATPRPAARGRVVSAACDECLEAGAVCAGHFKCSVSQEALTAHKAGRLYTWLEEDGWKGELPEPHPESVAALARIGSTSEVAPEDIRLAVDPDGTDTGVTAPTLDEQGRVVHTTGSGRTRWTVARDGSVAVEITRPTARARAARGCLREIDWCKFSAEARAATEAEAREEEIALRGTVARGRGLPHVVVDVLGPAYHVEHVDTLRDVLRAAGADERGLEIACRAAYEQALPDRLGRGRELGAVS